MSGAAPTTRPKDPLEKLLPGPLTSYREFPQATRSRCSPRSTTTSSRRTRSRSTHGEGRRRAADRVQTREERDSSDAGRLGRRLRLPGAHSAERHRRRASTCCASKASRARRSRHWSQAKPCSACAPARTGRCLWGTHCAPPAHLACTEPSAPAHPVGTAHPCTPFLPIERLDSADRPRAGRDASPMRSGRACDARPPSITGDRLRKAWCVAVFSASVDACFG